MPAMKQYTVSERSYTESMLYNVTDEIKYTFERLRRVLREETSLRNDLDALFAQRNKDAREEVRKAQRNLHLVTSEEADMRAILREEWADASSIPITNAYTGGDQLEGEAENSYETGDAEKESVGEDSQVDYFEGEYHMINQNTSPLPREPETTLPSEEGAPDTTVTSRKKNKNKKKSGSGGRPPVPYMDTEGSTITENKELEGEGMSVAEQHLEAEDAEVAEQQRDGENRISARRKGKAGLVQSDRLRQIRIDAQMRLNEAETEIATIILKRDELRHILRESEKMEDELFDHRFFRGTNEGKWRKVPLDFDPDALAQIHDMANTGSEYSFAESVDCAIRDEIDATVTKLKLVINEEASLRRMLDALFVKRKEKAIEQVKQANLYLYLVKDEETAFCKILQQAAATAYKDLGVSTSSCVTKPSSQAHVLASTEPLISPQGSKSSPLPTRIPMSQFTHEKGLPTKNIPDLGAPSEDNEHSSWDTIPYNGDSRAGEPPAGTMDEAEELKLVSKSVAKSLGPVFPAAKSSEAGSITTLQSDRDAEETTRESEQLLLDLIGEEPKGGGIGHKKKKSKGKVKATEEVLKSVGLKKKNKAMKLEPKREVDVDMLV